MKNIIAQTISSATDPTEMALRIKREAPTLASLSPEQLEQIARLVTTQRLAAELSTAVDLAGVLWEKERETFLNDAKSPHTRRAYANALDRLKAWTVREGIEPLTLNAAQADQFIRDLKTECRAPASTCRDIAAASSFFTFMERYHAAVKNPFRGTRIRPPNENQKEAIIPTAKEYKSIANAFPPIERAIIATMALRGLRSGALPTLRKKGARYYGKSKGKPLKEGETVGVTLPPEVIEALIIAGLDLKKPFADFNANSIERRINYHIGKLYQDGIVRAAFSCHDFRHLFAVTEYQKDRDILRVSRLLNHANIAITQKYLRSIGLEL